MPSLREAHLRHASYYINVLRQADDLYQTGGDDIHAGLMLFDSEAVNLQRGQEWVAMQVLEGEEAAHLCDDYPDAGAYCLDVRLPPQTRIQWLTSALNAARKLGRLDSEAVHLGNLGNAFMDLEQPSDAINFYEQALQIHLKRSDHGGESVMLNNLANAYTRLVDIQRAIELYQQALSIDRELGDHQGEGSDLGNLGTAYLLLGNTSRAIEFLEQHLALARAIGERRGESAALGNLGIAYKKMGELRRAIKFYEQQLTIVQELRDRHGEALASWNLGLAYEAAGDLDRANALLNLYINYQREFGAGLSEEDATRVQRLHDRVVEREKRIMIDE